MPRGVGAWLRRPLLPRNQGEEGAPVEGRVAEAAVVAVTPTQVEGLPVEAVGNEQAVLLPLHVVGMQLEQAPEYGIVSSVVASFVAQPLDVLLNVAQRAERPAPDGIRPSINAQPKGH